MIATTMRVALAAAAMGLATLTALPAGQQQGKKPGTTTPVPLIVDIEPSSTTQFRGVVSDGQSYIDGVAGSVGLDQYGNLIINVGPLRGFCYDYSSPADGQKPSGGPTCPGNTYMATSPNSLDPPPRKFQELGPGDSECIRGEPTYTVPDDTKKTLVRHLFQRSVNGIPATETNSGFLLATRTDGGGTPPRTWTVESVNTCNEFSGVARVVSYPQLGKYQLTDWGRYHMPMKLTLTEKTE